MDGIIWNDVAVVVAVRVFVIAAVDVVVVEIVDVKK